MPMDVGERLLTDAIEDKFRRARQAAVHPFGSNRSVNAILLVEFVDTPFERSNQSQIIENRRAQVNCHATHIFKRAYSQLAQFLDVTLCFIGVFGALEQADIDEQGCQRLSSLVVQFTGKTIAFFFLRL